MIKCTFDTNVPSPNGIKVGINLMTLAFIRITAISFLRAQPSWFDDIRSHDDESNEPLNPCCSSAPYPNGLSHHEQANDKTDVK